MRITRLRTNHLENPIGYAMSSVSLSWTVEEAQGARTALARVQVAADPAFTEILWDSGEQADLNSAACVADVPLAERTRYYWHVWVRDDAGDEAQSETAYYETAPDAIGGVWITAPYDKSVHGLYRKAFESTQEVQRARLYICGMGVYEAYLNGTKVGKEYLAPFYNDYNNWMQFQSYDVTDLIQGGSNTLGVMLGNGWFKGRFGFIDGLDQLYGDTQALICELEITWADGSTTRISSDESWQCHRSPVLESSIYDGEVYDANLAVDGFRLPRADGAAEAAASEDGWEPAVAADASVQAWTERLQPRRSLPLVLHEELRPVEVIHTPAGETVLDFGQNLSGLFSFVCSEPQGARVEIHVGEILQDDNFYNDNLRTAKEAYAYISDGVSRVVRPHFTFYGFRYMKVEGVSDIDAAQFTVQVLHSEMARTGNIETSNPQVNRLFLNALWGQKSNFVDVPTDCPQRDERMGWTGDAQVFSATASYNMYTPAFYAKFLYDAVLEQRDLNGSVPHVVPDILDQIAALRGEEQKAHGSCAWGETATVIPWVTYVFYGDKALLAEQYENMHLWVDYMREEDRACGDHRLWTRGFHYADWLALDTYRNDCLGGTDPYYIASACYLYSAELTAKAARALGKGEDASYYQGLADEIRAAMQREYFTETGRIAIDTQTAMVLALQMNIVPESARERMLARLREKLDQDKVHLTTGFVGTPYLCPMLTENGMVDYAYTLFLNEDFPSWLYEVNMGATTIWERWNSVLPDGRISDTGMNSLNHYAYGSIVEWMYRYMCGLNPSEENPGFRRFTVRPYPDARFEHARAEYESVYGTIVTGWRRVGDGWEYEVIVPFDTEAEFILPAGQQVRDAEAHPRLAAAGRVTLGPGRYVIETV